MTLYRFGALALRSNSRIKRRTLYRPIWRPSSFNCLAMRRETIFATMFFENGPNPGLQCHLVRIVRSFEAMKVIIKSAPADFHHLTQNGDGIGLLFLPDEVASQFDSFAKKAAAFFNISRSISSRLFSFFSRRISASSSLREIPPSLISCWSWRYCRTQRVH